MRFFFFQFKGHTWFYTFRPQQSREVLSRLYLDSRDPEAGFSLWHVAKFMKDARG